MNTAKQLGKLTRFFQIIHSTLGHDNETKMRYMNVSQLHDYYFHLIIS